MFINMTNILFSPFDFENLILDNSDNSDSNDFQKLNDNVMKIYCNLAAELNEISNSNFFIKFKEILLCLKYLIEVSSYYTLFIDLDKFSYFPLDVLQKLICNLISSSENYCNIVWFTNSNIDVYAMTLMKTLHIKTANQNLINFNGRIYKLDCSEYNFRFQEIYFVKKNEKSFRISKEDRKHSYENSNKISDEDKEQFNENSIKISDGDKKDLNEILLTNIICDVLPLYTTKANTNTSNTENESTEQNNKRDKLFFLNPLIMEYTDDICDYFPFQVDLYDTTKVISPFYKKLLLEENVYENRGIFNRTFIKDSSLLRNTVNSKILPNMIYNSNYLIELDNTIYTNIFLKQERESSNEKYFYPIFCKELKDYFYYQYNACFIEAKRERHLVKKQLCDIFYKKSFFLTNIASDKNFIMLKNFTRLEEGIKFIKSLEEIKKFVVTFI